MWDRSMGTIHSRSSRTVRFSLAAGRSPASNFPGQNADGSFDSTFGGDGTISTNFSDRANVNSIAVQSDGKVIAAGYATGLTVDFALVRYNTDGSVDTSFGTDGKVIRDLGNQPASATSVVVQSDGKLVVAGQANVGLNSDFAIARYNADGSLDVSFGGTGKVTTPVVVDKGDYVQAVAVHSNGKIVAAGHTENSSGSTDIAVARYNSDGSLDTSFDGDGKVTTNLSGSDFDFAAAVAILPDEKILVVGRANQDFAAYPIQH